MSASNVSRIEYFRDIALAAAALAFGRLFPTLKPPPADLTGKVAIITGGNSGIGLAIGLALARQGATVYLACRNVSKAEAAVSEIVSQVPASEGRVKSLTLDTSSLDSVRSFAGNWETLQMKVDLLFHNAGIGSIPKEQKWSTDGFPLMYATNFLGSFLLTNLLEPHLSSEARIVFTSSTGQYGSSFTSDFSLSSVVRKSEPGFHITAAKFTSENSISDSVPYSHTKAMQVAFARLLQSRFDRQAAQAGIQNRKVAHAFSPDFTSTPIFDKTAASDFFEEPLFWILKMTYSFAAIDVSQGAATGVWLASTKDETVVGEGMGGGYWDRMTRRLSSIDLISKDDVERFWIRWEADAGVEWR